jgi:outer membrane lipoprotein-sorting protein
MKRPDNPEISGQAYALSPNLLRIDWNGTDQKTISITDYAKGEFVAIESKAKSARVFKTSESSGYDIVKRLREAQAGSGRSVTPKGEADRDTEVFEIREGDAISTIWVNVKAKLPIRCELRVPDKPALGSVVYSDFDWNPVIAESKFAIPEGFTRVEDDLHAEPTEEQFVAALRIRQAFTDEPYPAEFLSDSPGLLIGRSAYDSGRSPDQNHARQLTQLQLMLNDLGLMIPQAQDRKLLQQRIDFLCMKADQFQTVILSTGRWVGGGVTPGDPDKPLCWWRPRKSDRVRVLYGDLTVREAPEPPAAK